MVKVVGSAGVCAELAASHARPFCVYGLSRRHPTLILTPPPPSPAQDAINRRVATETLLAAAYEGHTRQHIFLTPQDIQVGEAEGEGRGGGEGGGGVNWMQSYPNLTPVRPACSCDVYP